MTTRRILRLTTLSIFAIGVAAACSKKDATDAAIDGGNNLAQCPALKPASYKLENSAGPAKVIEISKVADPKAKDRSYYKLVLNGLETLVLNGDSAPQSQDKIGLPALKAGCVDNKILISGKGASNADVAVEISTASPMKDASGAVWQRFTLKNHDDTFSYVEATGIGAAISKAGTTGVSGIPMKSDLAQGQPNPADQSKPATAPGPADQKPANPLAPNTK